MSVQFELMRDQSILGVWRHYHNPLFPWMVYIKQGHLTAPLRDNIFTYCEHAFGTKGSEWDKESIWFYFKTEDHAVQFLLTFS